MIGAASPVCQRGMDGTEPAWTTNFACCVTPGRPWRSRALASVAMSTPVPERTENCGRQRSPKGNPKGVRSVHAQVDPLRETTFQAACHSAIALRCRVEPY